MTPEHLFLQLPTLCASARVAGGVRDLPKCAVAAVAAGPGPKHAVLKLAPLHCRQSSFCLPYFPLLSSWGRGPPSSKKRLSGPRMRTIRAIRAIRAPQSSRT